MWVQIPAWEVFCKFAWLSSTEQNHANFAENEFLPSNSETQTFRHVQCAEPWRLEWCVLIPEAVTQETNFVIPNMHCLNKLLGKSRAGIDCVGFCACESAVSRWDSCIFTTTLAEGRFLGFVPVRHNNEKPKNRCKTRSRTFSYVLILDISLAWVQQIYCRQIYWFLATGTMLC